MSAARAQTAVHLRAAVVRLAKRFALAALGMQLPLRFPALTAAEVPTVFRARSWYTYPGWAELLDAARLASQQSFYLVLHLIDFSPLRGELVRLTGIHTNAPGQTPFDPVSLFLCCLLRWETTKGWKTLARFLASPEGACWCQLLGFSAGITPAAATLRAFFHALGPAFATSLCPRFMHLLHTAGLLPPHAAQSCTPARDGLPVATDGMLHAAHSSQHCAKVTTTCYRPTTPEHPRPCPARAAGKAGCACHTDACREHCQRATPRDPDASYIHYTGRNRAGTTDTQHARDVYGYRSYAHTLVDDALHTYWVAYTSVHPANTDERGIFPQDFAQLQEHLPRLPISEVVADAALGYAPCLNTIYAARAIPIVAIRHDPSDDDPDLCLLRGYDAHGRPLCPHGHPLSFNGLDYDRLRACWSCRQVCTHSPEARPEDVDCPFRDPRHPLGMVKHVTQAFTHPDGSQHARLLRLFPLDSPSWKTRYGRRRNATESRNAQLEQLGLKRVWSYGLTGATTDITFADLLINLRNLGRLVQQASTVTD